MTSKVLVFLGVAMGVSLAYAEAFQAPELEPSIAGSVLAPGFLSAQKYAAAFRQGAHDACKQSDDATRRLANMLQANCVAADLSAGMDRSEIFRHCYAAPHRSSFIRRAEEICAAQRVYAGFRLARDDGQSDQSDGCVPPKRCLRQ
jgi:hypothetical protein